MKSICQGVFEQFAACLLEQREPAIEQLQFNSIDAMMDGHRVSLIAAGRQHDGGPEVAHRCEMRSPVAGDGPRKDWTKLWINPDLGVEAIHRAVDCILRKAINLFCLHR